MRLSKAGRTAGEPIKDKSLGGVMVDSGFIALIVQAAAIENQSVSDWVRGKLGTAAKRAIRKAKREVTYEDIVGILDRSKPS